MKEGHRSLITFNSLKTELDHDNAQLLPIESLDIHAIIKFDTINKSELNKNKCKQCLTK